MNILYYGNCQLYAILKTLNLPSKFNTTLVECWKEDIDQQYFTDLIVTSNIIITQPINDNYRKVDYLSTNYIKKHKRPDCKLILFDSCYFDFYYFDVTYTHFNNNILHKPIDYHYHGMMKCYKNNDSIEHYIHHYVNNLELKTSEELETLAENSLRELHNRFIDATKKYKDDMVYIISTHDYIKSNYKDKLLFYSMNHPSKYVIQFICESIIDILQIENTMNYELDLLENPKCILYQCISKCVNFDIHAHKPLTVNSTDIYKITELYYNTYHDIDFK
jgi:hypothetical protein